MLFVLEEVPNPELRNNEFFSAYEDYHHPRVRKLREQYDLGRITSTVDGEWNRILALRHWIRSRIEIENDNPSPCRMEAFSILEEAERGGRFHCAHFSLVLHAVLNSCGYVCRRLQCGPGENGDDGNHGVNEVWVNEFCKWVLIDAKYDSHFEKQGRPLSALEVRDEVWRNGGEDVVAVVGPECRPLLVDVSRQMKGLLPRVVTYRWCAWEIDTNRFTAWPSLSSSTLAVYADDIFRSHTWMRDGKPHWAYGTSFLVEVTDRRIIEWTPNVTAAAVDIAGDRALLRLRTCTPNFRSFQIRVNDGDWTDCDDRPVLPLGQGHNTCKLRSANLFGVCGPEHTVSLLQVSSKACAQSE